MATQRNEHELELGSSTISWCIQCRAKHEEWLDGVAGGGRCSWARTKLLQCSQLGERLKLASHNEARNSGHNNWKAA